MADQTLPSYPQSFGSRNVNITQHTGPASYNNAVGDVVTASTFGWGSFDHLEGGQSFNNSAAGTYTVKVQYPIGQAILGASGSNNATLFWFNANGTAVANNTNLSAEYARIKYIGG